MPSILIESRDIRTGNEDVKTKVEALAVRPRSDSDLRLGASGCCWVVNVDLTTDVKI